MGKYIIAHDLGTSGNKACLFGVDGEFIDSSYTTYPAYYTADGGAEQNPEDWWDAVRQSTIRVLQNARVDKRDVIAISFSSQGGALVPMDRDGNNLRGRSMVWMDARAAEQGERIRAEFGPEVLFDKTGSWTGYDKSMMAKLMWIREHEPEIYEKTYKFIGCKEYIIYKMTGHMGWTDRSGNGLFNINTLEPDEDILSFCKLDMSKLPEVRECYTPVAHLTKDAAIELGLNPSALVVLGSWDNFACGVGGGAAIAGNAVNYLGTAGWIAVTSDKRLGSFQDRVGTWRINKDLYFYSFNSHSAGPAFNWVLNLTLPNWADRPGAERYQEAERLARAVPPGSEGVWHIPSYYGGNTFLTDQRICGTFLGLKLTHSAGHMIRAAMEGVVGDISLGYDFFARNGVDIQTIRAIGGGASNRLWLEMLAGLYARPVAVPANKQHIGALGAMIMAGIGAGIYSDYGVSLKFLKTVEEIPALEENVRAYRGMSEKYSRTFKALADFYCGA